MRQQKESASNIIAKIQSLQDLFSRHYKVFVGIYNNSGVRFTVCSNNCFYCHPACTEENSFCKKRFLHYLKNAEETKSIVYFTCPNQLTSAIIPLGVRLDTNVCEQPSFYIVVGRIRIANPMESFLEGLGSVPKIENSMEINYFREIVQMVASSFELVFGLIDFTDISLEPQPPFKKEDYDRLTKREIEIVRLVSMGLSNQEIADQLFISEHTVKSHISNVLKKLCLNNRTKLALFEFQTL